MTRLLFFWSHTHTDAPIFAAGTETVVLSVSDGESGTINCSSTGVPDLINTTLSRDGDSIPLDDNTFTIPSASSQDAGIYTCTATNEVGSTTLTVDVQVGFTPGTVSDIRLDVDDNKLTISWNAADGRGVRVTHYDIVIEYEDEMIEATVLSPSLMYTVMRDTLGIPKEGKEIMIKISITAVNDIGRGESASHDTTAKFGPIMSSSLSTLPCAIILMTCTALAMYVLV